jgi:hypothetical protein
MSFERRLVSAVASVSHIQKARGYADEKTNAAMWVAYSFSMA